MANTEIYVTEDRSTLLRKLSQFWDVEIEQRCKELAVSRPGCPLIVGLSGGSMPTLLEAVLHMRFQLPDWSNIVFIYCDERLVPFHDPDSTHGIYLKQFVKELNVPTERFVYINPDLTVTECAEDYEKKLRALNPPTTSDGVIICDVLFLGLGPDGHTCSLFPDHDLLKERSCIVAPISDSPKPPPERVTLTLPVLNAARRVAFVTTGDSKADVVKDILENKDSSHPGALVQPMAADAKLTWFLDAGAASKLDPSTPVITSAIPVEEENEHVKIN